MAFFIRIYFVDCVLCCYRRLLREPLPPRPPPPREPPLLLALLRLLLDEREELTLLPLLRLLFDERELLTLLLLLRLLLDERELLTLLRLLLDERDVLTLLLPWLLLDGREVPMSSLLLRFELLTIRVDVVLLLRRCDALELFVPLFTTMRLPRDSPNVLVVERLLSLWLVAL